MQYTEESSKTYKGVRKDECAQLETDAYQLLSVLAVSEWKENIPCLVTNQH